MVQVTFQEFKNNFNNLWATIGNNEEDSPGSISSKTTKTDSFIPLPVDYHLDPSRNRKQKLDNDAAQRFSVDSEFENAMLDALCTIYYDKKEYQQACLEYKPKTNPHCYFPVYVELKADSSKDHNDCNTINNSDNNHNANNNHNSNNIDYYDPYMYYDNNIGCTWDQLDEYNKANGVYDKYNNTNKKENSDGGFCNIPNTNTNTNTNNGTDGVDNGENVENGQNEEADTISTHVSKRRRFKNKIKRMFSKVKDSSIISTITKNDDSEDITEDTTTDAPENVIEDVKTKEANIKETNIKEANFKEANTKQADFKQANLQQANTKEDNNKGINIINGDDINADIINPLYISKKKKNIDAVHDDNDNRHNQDSPITNNSIQGSGIISLHLSKRKKFKNKIKRIFLMEKEEE